MAASRRSIGTPAPERTNQMAGSNVWGFCRRSACSWLGCAASKTAKCTASPLSNLLLSSQSKTSEKLSEILASDLKIGPPAPPRFPRHPHVSQKLEFLILNQKITRDPPNVRTRDGCQGRTFESTTVGLLEMSREQGVRRRNW